MVQDREISRRNFRRARLNCRRPPLDVSLIRPPPLRLAGFICHPNAASKCPHFEATKPGPSRALVSAESRKQLEDRSCSPGRRELSNPLFSPMQVKFNQRRQRASKRVCSKAHTSVQSLTGCCCQKEFQRGFSSRFPSAVAPKCGRTPRAGWHVVGVEPLDTRPALVSQCDCSARSLVCLCARCNFIC